MNSSPAATGVNESLHRALGILISGPAALLNQHRAIESEITLEQAREIPLQDMNQAELTAVILHDPDITERRAALRLLKLEILLDAETRIMRALTEARK